MPKSLQWILDHQDDLAKQFEAFEPDPDGHDDANAFARLLRAANARVEAEAEIADAVVDARGANHSWAMIGGALGTTGQAAQQRYGKLTTERG